MRESLQVDSEPHMLECESLALDWESLRFK
jgi:hypothetical protein